MALSVLDLLKYYISNKKKDKEIAMSSVKIDLDIYSSCKTCVKACFVDVIRWDDGEEEFL